MASNKIVFTDSAREDLDSILKYVSYELHNFDAAKKIYYNIVKTIDNISLFPESYPLINNDLIKDKIRKAVVDNYNMYYFYKKDKKIIYILRIVYYRKNNNQLFDK